MDILNIIMRILHVGGAVTLVGGLAFGALVLLPALRLTDDAYRKALLEIIGRRFIVALHAAMAALIFSGAYNWHLNFNTYAQLKTANKTQFMVLQGLLGLKVLLALIIFAWVIKSGPNVLAQSPPAT
ncbi:MAG: hypothetical protein CMJ49_11070 [Planctomycetaceae bacterium]|jgi:uncharacterized membrane protein|nr:hypothetical protein [Planctomycetaceae bacterium]